MYIITSTRIDNSIVFLGPFENLNEALNTAENFYGSKDTLTLRIKTGICKIYKLGRALSKKKVLEALKPPARCINEPISISKGLKEAVENNEVSVEFPNL